MRDLASQLGVNGVYFKKMNVHAYNQKIALPEGFISDLEGEKKRTPPACLNGWFYMAVKLDGISAPVAGSTRCPLVILIKSLLSRFGCQGI